MTEKEALAVLEIQAIDLTGLISGMRKENPLVDVVQQRLDAIDLAQRALKERIERRENEPLTLEQLREMDGEPVWVRCLKLNKYIDPPVKWRILEKSITGAFGVWDGENCLIERDYGTDWLAYRHPQKEDA